MSDELAGKVGFNQTTQTGQSAQTGSASTQEQVKPTEPQYITRDEFSTQMEEVKRFSQGLVDKNVSRLDKRVSDATTRVNQLIDMGKKTGMQFTPEQEAQMRSMAIDEALTKSDTETQTLQPQASPAQAGEAVTESSHPVVQWAVNLIKAAGLPDDAPEIAMIDTRTNIESEYRKSVLSAITAYNDTCTPSGFASSYTDSIIWWQRRHEP